MSTRPRRWFSFSLRTMFIIVTAVCCYLAWQSSIVRGRQSALRELRTTPGVQITTAAARAGQLPLGSTPPPAATIPLVRRWLGDEAIQEIAIGRGYHTLSSEQIAGLKRVFPEAEIREFELPLEPCHPGCFPRGTLVDTPQGSRAIETIETGESLTAIDSGGQPLTVTVQSVFVTTNRLWKITTEDGSLLTTEKQPLCLADGFVPLPAGQLQCGDVILRRKSGRVYSAKVLDVAATERIEKVFNLVLGNREVFVAGGYLARSKPPAE